MANAKSRNKKMRWPRVNTQYNDGDAEAPKAATSRGSDHFFGSCRAPSARGADRRAGRRSHLSLRHFKPFRNGVGPPMQLVRRSREAAAVPGRIFSERQEPDQAEPPAGPAQNTRRGHTLALIV